MIAGFILSAYLQLSLVSGFTYIPGDTMYSDRYQITLPPQAIEIGLEARRSIGDAELKLFGTSDTYLTVHSMDSATPMTLSWSVGAELKYKNMSVGYIRACQHPFSAYMIENIGNTASISRSMSEGISRKAYIRFEIGGN